MRRPHFLLAIACIGAFLAGAVPVALSVIELTKLRHSIASINEASEAARNARLVAEKIELALTDFTAVALEIDSDERDNILPAADRQISTFLEAVVVFKKKIGHWLSEPQEKELSESTQALFHSWEEITRQHSSDLSGAEKTYHFLQLADSAKAARAVLVNVEAYATSLAETQTSLSFERLRIVGVLLIAAIVAGFLINAGGTYRIFRYSEATRRTNVALESANDRLKNAEVSLKNRTEQLIEAQSLGGIGDWSYRFGNSEVHWAAAIYDLLRYPSATFTPTPRAIKNIYIGNSARRLKEAQSRVAATGGVKTVDVKCKRGDGTHGHFAVTTKAQTENGRVVGFFGTILDITERKESEEQLEKLAYYDPLTGLEPDSKFVIEQNQRVSFSLRPQLSLGQIRAPPGFLAICTAWHSMVRWNIVILSH